MDVVRLTRGMAKGQEEAYALLLARYGWRLFRMAVGHLHGDISTAEDLIQETMLRVVRRPKICDTEDELCNWLGMIVRNVAIDHLRREVSQRRRLMNMGVPAEGYEPIQPDDLVELALRRLDPPEVELIMLRYQQGLSVREVAKRLEITEEAAESRLSRARSRLRVIMEGLDPL